MWDVRLPKPASVIGKYNISYFRKLCLSINRYYYDVNYFVCVSSLIIEKYDGSSVPTCVRWQPGSAWSLAVGMECGSLVYRDCRRDAGEPARNTQKLQIHNRPITKLAFSSKRFVTWYLFLDLLLQYQYCCLIWDVQYLNRRKSVQTFSSCQFHDN